MYLLWKLVLDLDPKCGGSQVDQIFRSPIILVKSRKSDDIGCPILNGLEFNMDATTKSFFSQNFLD